jgi:ammonia channel protein AmtB
MTGSPTVLLLATAGITLLLAPALALFFGGRPDRRRRGAIAVAIPASMLVTAIAWMLLGSDPGVAAYQGSLAAAAVAVVLAVGLRTGCIRGYAVFTALWLVLVLVPVGYSLFDLVRGPLVRALGTLDFGGASILALCTGTAGVALSIVSHRRGNAVGGLPQRSVRAFVFSGLAALLGFLAVDVGAELVLDTTTLTLAANELWAALAGLVGWTVAQLINVHRPTWAGLVAGVLAGSIVVLPASPWLDTTSVVVLGLIAGILGQVAAVAARRSGAGAWATLVGVCLVPGAVGLIGTGIVARGLGLVFSGHIDLLAAQAGGLVIVVGYSLIVTTVIALVVDRTLGLTGTSRLVDETIVRLYAAQNSRDIDAVLSRLHATIRWPNGWEGTSLEGSDAVRASLTRQWGELNPTVTPLRSHRVAGGWIEVDVHQVLRNPDGVVITDSTLVHAYRERDGLFDRMELR